MAKEDTTEKSFDREELERLVESKDKWAEKVYAAAQYYISLGWPVVPIQYGRKQLPYPDQAKKRGLSKAPAYADASTAPDRIKHWFHPQEGLWRGMNLGLVCGDSVSAVDLDVKDDIDGFSNFTSLYGSDFGRTPMQETPSGGMHILFQHEGGFTSKTSVLPGVDTRGSSKKGAPGSHIVVYPSVVDIHGDGTIQKVAYKWTQGGPLGRVPEDFLQRLQKVVEFKPKAGPGRGNENVDEEDYFPDATLDDVRSALETLEAECDYDLWVKLGQAIHSSFPGDDGFDVWHEWSKTVDNGKPIGRGKGNPYHGKSAMWKKWRTFDDDGDGVKIASLFWHARRAGYRKPGELSPELVEGLRYTDKGSIQRTNHNLWVILQSKEFQEEFGGRLKYDRFLDCVSAGDVVFINEKYTKVSRWISTKFQVEFGKDTTRDYCRMVAMDNSFDSLNEFVTNLVWDGEDRLDRLCKELCCKNDYQRQAVKRWLIGGVARATRPGCTSTHLLVLFGEQGVGKSRFFRAMSPRPEWFTDAIVLKFGRGDTAHRDQEVLLQGKWVVEIPELAGIWKSDDNDTKNWLTLQSPRVSKKYDPDAVELPRRVLFGGTTNLDGVIQDATGSRRFAFLTIGGYKIDVEWVTKNAEQIWAQAKTWLDEGENWWFNDEEFEAQIQENTAFKRSHPWEEAISDWSKDKSRFTTDDIFMYVLDKPMERRTHKDSMDIGSILKGLGFKKLTIKVGDRTMKGWKNSDPEVDNQFAGSRWLPAGEHDEY